MGTQVLYSRIKLDQRDRSGARTLRTADEDDIEDHGLVPDTTTDSSGLIDATREVSPGSEQRASYSPSHPSTHYVTPSLPQYPDSGLPSNLLAPAEAQSAFTIAYRDLVAFSDSAFSEMWEHWEALILAGHVEILAEDPQYQASCRELLGRKLL